MTCVLVLVVVLVVSGTEQTGFADFTFFRGSHREPRRTNRRITDGFSHALCTVMVALIRFAPTSSIALQFRNSHKTDHGVDCRGRSDPFDME